MTNEAAINESPAKNDQSKSRPSPNKMIARKIPYTGSRLNERFTVNLSFNLEPVYGIFLAIVLFGESRDFDRSFFAGLSLIAASLIIHIVMLLIKERKIVLQNAVDELP